MLEIFRIPTSKDEGTKGIVCKLASLVKMQDFSKDQIDVAYTTSSKPTAPIIVLFYKKNDRHNFYQQKFKVKTLIANQFSDDAEEEEHLKSNDIEPTQTIYINENLTRKSRELLKLTREEAKKLKFKYNGYTVKGEIRVRKNESSGYIVIWSKSDVQKIT